MGEHRLHRRFVRVRHQLSQQRELAELKTDRGRRDVALMPELAALLREHRMATLRKGPRDFLFTAPDGRPRDQRSTARRIERAVIAAGLGDEKVSAHNFRHTFASLLIVGSKMDPVSVAAQVGHSDPSVTLKVYSHLFEKARSANEIRSGLSEGFGHLLAERG